MTDSLDFKTKVINFTNEYYAEKGLKKTISEDNWTKVIKNCSVKDADEAGSAICDKLGIEPPSGDIKQLALEGLDAVTAYIVSETGEPGEGIVRLLGETHRATGPTDT